jgi:hypothetical protein
MAYSYFDWVRFGCGTPAIAGTIGDDPGTGIGGNMAQNAAHLVVGLEKIAFTACSGEFHGTDPIGRKRIGSTAK